MGWRKKIYPFVPFTRQLHLPYNLNKVPSVLPEVMAHQLVVMKPDALQLNWKGNRSILLGGVLAIYKPNLSTNLNLLHKSYTQKMIIDYRVARKYMQFLHHEIKATQVLHQSISKKFLIESSRLHQHRRKRPFPLSNFII